MIRKILVLSFMYATMHASFCSKPEVSLQQPDATLQRFIQKNPDQAQEMQIYLQKVKSMTDAFEIVSAASILMDLNKKRPAESNIDATDIAQSKLQKTA